MGKYKAMLVHTINLVVEAESEDDVYEWMLETTPSEAVEAILASKPNGTWQESFDEEYLGMSDAPAALTITSR